MTQSMFLPRPLKQELIASVSRMSMYICLYCRISASRRRRFQCVEASGPKKRARMSLSIPTIRNPSADHRRTASDPINPAAPVTTQTDIHVISFLFSPAKEWDEEEHHVSLNTSCGNPSLKHIAHEGMSPSRICRSLQSSWSPQSVPRNLSTTMIRCEIQCLRPN